MYSIESEMTLLCHQNTLFLSFLLTVKIIILEIY